MRFKKGSKVEVLCRKNVPSGAWRLGEIISVNSRSYNVRYDCPSGVSDKDIMERVLRKAIRPCPPSVDGPDGWTTGDVIEVFDNLSWKTAMVLEVSSENYYWVRILGSPRELQIKKVNIRVQQVWRDGKWVVIGQGSGSCEDLKSNKLSTLNCHQKMTSPVPQGNVKTKVQAGENCLAVENYRGFQESCTVLARSLKRASPFWSSDLEAYNEKADKLRAIVRKGVVAYPSSFTKKVDVVAYPQECLGDICMHASLGNQTVGFCEMERRKSNYFFESFHARNAEPNDSDFDACSVGSCSVIHDSTGKLSNQILPGNSPDADIFSSDAESFNGCPDEEEKCSLTLGEDVVARIHRLELHAYRCILEALYASGPLTWEQEALLTNLRISLNISNDEHLMELRNLISAGTSHLY